MQYDVIILGSGPAGLSAGLYAGRYNLKTLVIGAILGGAMSEAWKIENWPGDLSIAGPDLAKKMKKQVEKLGVKILEDEINKVQKENSKFKIVTLSGKTYESKSLILALGTERRKLKVPGEEKLHGRGVSYCATCDGPFFKNKIVAVVGGGDTAVKTALLMIKYASQVYLIVRGNKLSCEPTNACTIEKNPKIKIINDAEVTEIKGSDKVEAIKLNNGKEIKVGGVFIEIGATPASVLIKDLKVALDEKGYIKVDENQKTNIPFVYAAGDVTNALGGFKQTITAAAQGAVAGTSAYRDLCK